MTNWIPVSERMPTAEDASERGEVVWRFAEGTTITSRFDDKPFSGHVPVEWFPLPRHEPPKPGPTDTECANILQCANILHYSALACTNHLNPKDDVPREEQFAMVRRWFSSVTARIEREKGK